MAVLALLGMLVGGCTDGETTTPASPSPRAAPSLDAVHGERRPRAPSAASAHVLGTGSVPPVQATPAGHLAGQVATWLDHHLEDLQRGGSGHLTRVAAPGLVEAAGPEILEAATSGLATRWNPVRKAVYDLTVAQVGPPRWLTAEVTVTRHSGRVVTATFVFVPSDQGPRLVAFGPGDRPPPPAPSPAPKPPSGPSPASSP